MIYVDTSAWVSLHVNEARSTAMQDWFETQPVQDMACAEWVKTEYASVLSMKKRRGDLDDRNFELAHQAFAQICVAGPVWLDVQTEDFFAAAALCVDGSTRLRAGDALHLAVARRARCEAFLSFDNLLNENAQRLGLRVIRP
ncbi:MAG: type II toxin-antitoxin system VapC family toxin [Variovorax sp.]